MKTETIEIVLSVRLQYRNKNQRRKLVEYLKEELKEKNDVSLVYDEYVDFGACAVIVEAKEGG